jgi:hypothetical protein
MGIPQHFEHFVIDPKGPTGEVKEGWRPSRPPRRSSKNRMSQGV